MDLTEYQDPLSRAVAQQLEDSDPLPGGFRAQFHIPTKADLARTSQDEGPLKVQSFNSLFILIPASIIRRRRENRVYISLRKLPWSPTHCSI